MPKGKGTYGTKRGRPKKKKTTKKKKSTMRYQEIVMKKMKNSTDNYAQTQKGTGMNSTDNMNDGAIDRMLTPKQRTLPMKLKKAILAGKDPRMSKPAKQTNKKKYEKKK